VTPTKKHLAYFGAFALAVSASIVSLFPQTVGLGAPVKAIADEARKAAENIPDTCPFDCGDAGRGAIMPLDGGVRGICECGG
jgi:hypothetical protein